MKSVAGNFAMLREIPIPLSLYLPQFVAMTRVAILRVLVIQVLYGREILFTDFHGRQIRFDESARVSVLPPYAIIRSILSVARHFGKLIP
jgi:hypothetical protein